MGNDVHTVPILQVSFYCLYTYYSRNIDKIWVTYAYATMYSHAHNFLQDILEIYLSMAAFSFKGTKPIWYFLNAFKYLSKYTWMYCLRMRISKKMRNYQPYR